MKFNPLKLNNYPIDPGVYLMKARGGEIIYIGKAKSLRNRLKQYFVTGGDGRWMIPYLLENLEEIETLVTVSEKEALLLENNLIKQHQPRYNALLKDDKTYTALKVTTQSEWPKLELVRYKGKPKKDGLYFGPYASTYAARETLDLLQRIFPLRQCSDQEFLRRTRPCILYGMKRCSAPCVGYITKERYDQDVSEAIRFLKGQNEEVLALLYKKMEAEAAALEFEKAEEILKTIRSVEKTLESQRVDSPLEGFSGDVLGLYREGDEVLISRLSFERGRLIGYRHHNFSKIAESDQELFTSFLLQNYQAQELLPKEVLLPIELEDALLVHDLIALSLFTPQRGPKKELLAMAKRNAEAAFKQKKDENKMRENLLTELQEKLELSRFPEKIECYDISHLSGKEAVGSRVAFTEGKPDKKNYRLYRLKETAASDDYGAMREVLSRRFSKEGEGMPDLIIIDGGKGHLNAARQILQELNVISCDLIAVAKEMGRHDKGATLEQVYLPDRKDPLKFAHHAPLLFLLQRIRDEAHRFALSFQTKRRTKSSLHSALTQIPGIGPVKQKRLLTHFGSLKRLLQATDEEILKIKGLQNKDLIEIRKMI